MKTCPEAQYYGFVKPVTKFGEQRRRLASIGCGNVFPALT
jgi:hypothetical protein